MKWNIKVFGKKNIVEGTSNLSQQTEVRPGGWRLIRDPKTGQQKRVYLTQKADQFWLHVNGQALFGEKTPVRAAGVGGLESGADGLVAEFPGKIRKILCRTGGIVKKGEALLLVEAMKMEFTVTAPIPGTVKTIHVHEGQQVLPGVRFLELDGFREAK